MNLSCFIRYVFYFLITKSIYSKYYLVDFSINIFNVLFDLIVFICSLIIKFMQLNNIRLYFFYIRNNFRLICFIY